MCQSRLRFSGAQKEQVSSLPLPVSPCPGHSLGWQAPGAGEDVVLLGEEAEHAVQVASQQVLAAQLDHAWEVVDFLKVGQKNPDQQRRCGDGFSPPRGEPVRVEPVARGKPSLWLP